MTSVSKNQILVVIRRYVVGQKIKKSKAVIQIRYEQSL